MLRLNWKPKEGIDFEGLFNKQVLTHFDLPLPASSVAEILGMMVDPDRTEGDHSEQVALYGNANEPMEVIAASSWNVDVFASVVSELVRTQKAPDLTFQCPDLSWVHVIEHLDYPEFHLGSVEGLKLIVALCKKVLPSFSLADAILKKWKNAEAQLSFIIAAMSSPSEVFSFPPSPEVLELLDSQQLNALNATNCSCYLSLPLVSTLLRLSNESTSFHSKIYELLQVGAKQHPKVLLFALSLISHQVCGTRS